MGHAERVTIIAPPHPPVSWPHQVGVPPRRARSFQHRQPADRLREAATDSRRAGLTHVLTGTGGVGKTQIAADHARTAIESGTIDLLVWVNAGTRPAVVASYAQAAAEIVGADKAQPEQAARAFLAWLQPKAGRTPPRRWLIVLDDVADPSDLHELWPPASPHGRTLITTRRRDAALAGEGHHTVDVGLFTPAEATAYLTRTLAAHGRHEPVDDLAALATDLGHLPLALSQAAAYLIDAALDCVTYRDRLADQANRLADYLPDVLPDGQTAAVSAVWTLSIDRANQLRPTDLARPMLHLTAMLDPNGIPQAALTSPPALAHLGARDQAQAVGALRALHRLSLIDHSPGDPQESVRVHQLLQRSLRDALPTERREHLARATAEALLAAWPETGRVTELTERLISNGLALSSHSRDTLWRIGCYTVLFRVGTGLGDSGQVTSAVASFERLASEARRHLGDDHRDTLAARGAWADSLGEAGDASAAVAAYTDLLADRVRVLGPRDHHTLRTRHNLARWHGMAGDPVAAANAFSELLSELRSVLGVLHPFTLSTLSNFAHHQGLAGFVKGAVDTYTGLVPILVRELGPDDPLTLNARNNLAFWQGHAGDVAAALGSLPTLLKDVKRALGPRHSLSLTVRHNLAHWRGEAGDAAGAAAALSELVVELAQLLPASHPRLDATRTAASYWQNRAEGADQATE